ncbi:cytochrome c biogenesis protein CcsA [Winogradskyella jejuensis]|uniref:Cytochrome c-type biogenesis protein CcsB n=1 Tax=Winogradskyella jejuensis TaxID=1089305 RepID=A0A1M5V063_9FLAO|nr:cytochrome c biogenesis protein CcsA [Winogradskyella jejuensis]SHH68566.1 cytochrome c-type biogenesis protein CcsB [Winogradskyella jejuensis]
MQKKIANFLFSTRLTGILFIVFAVAMAVGTILDRNMETSPTPYTRELIYNAWWFEAIMVFFLINFFGNIGRYRLWRKEKWATLILHLSWILIIVGAGVTRYIGYEGAMPIREGETANQMLSLKTYIKGRIVGDYKVKGQNQQRNVEEEVDFSPRLNNDFNKTYDYGDTEVTIALKDFIVGAEKDIIPEDNGEAYLKIVEAGNGKPHNHFLKDGEIENIHNILFTLNKYQEGAINITNTEEGLFIQSPYDGEYLTMATMTQGKLVKDSLQPLALRSRYVIENMQIVFPKPVVKGKFGVVKKSKILKNDEDGVVLDITANGETKEIGLLGGQGSYNGFENINVGGLDIELFYGSKIIELPFSIKLNDFIAEKYPGTQNVPKSFESKVTVFDGDKEDFDYRIYMNHVLDHKGFRFFQSGYDPDEKGTILSVNHDMWGTYITYAGYLLLYFGLLAIMFAKHTRFDDLRKQLEKLKKKKAKLLTVLFLSFGLFSFSQEHSADDGHDHGAAIERPQKALLDSILKANITPQEHADKFAKMVIQDVSGRMMPMHTFASEVLRKLSKKDTYEDFSATQIFLSIQESPQLWYNMPVIYLTPRKADTVRSIIGVGTSEKYVSLLDFINPNGTNKLDPYLEEAFSAAIPNGTQKEIKMAYERLSLLSGIIEGRSLKIFPVPNDENNTWISSYEYKSGRFNKEIKETDSLYGNFIRNGFSYYLMTLNAAKQKNDFTNADRLLEDFKSTQKKYGSEVMLTDAKVETEIAYNKYDIFKRLFSWYMYASTLLFILLIWQILKHRSKALEVAVKILVGVIVFLFVLHIGGLIARWYLSGHAPWSDAYESMIYVSWATMLFGLLFGRKSRLTIAASAFVVSVILMVAHWNWMDPAIGNLQPVLQGYWLMIHVSVIVASYGPFAIGMILGLVALFLMIMTNNENKERIKINIKEITIINELALTVGLVMLTIGNFLGGMWANESWGRYWGWDPKETWALISIMLYAFVIHMRLIPGLRSKWLYNLFSVLTFGSILMTYFGVNFYLSGLHAYASGDQIISFQFIAITVVIISIIAFFAYRKYKAHY